MYYSPIIFFLTGFLLSSCQENLSIPGGTNEKARVSLSVSAASTSSPHTGSEGKDAINSLHILVFFGNRTTVLYGEQFAYAVKATRQKDNTFVATLLPSEHDKNLYRIVLLANADDTKIAKLSMWTPYVDISSTLYEDARQRYPADAPVPMFGVVDGGECIQITENMSLGNIKLIRAVARVDIGVGTYDPGTEKWNLAPSASDKYFTLTDVEAWSPMNRNLCMPGFRKFGYETDGTPLVTGASVDLGHSATTALKWRYTGADISNNSENEATFCKNIIYLPEAPLAGYTANQVADRGKRTTLIIGGLLHDPDNPVESGTKTWYRVDFTEAVGNTPDGPLFDILRNHLYRFSLNVQRRGASSAQEAWELPAGEIIQITMGVVPWEDGGLIDMPISPAARH